MASAGTRCALSNLAAGSVWLASLHRLQWWSVPRFASASRLPGPPPRGAMMEHGAAGSWLRVAHVVGLRRITLIGATRPLGGVAFTSRSAQHANHVCRAVKPLDLPPAARGFVRVLGVPSRWPSAKARFGQNQCAA